MQAFATFARGMFWTIGVIMCLIAPIAVAFELPSLSSRSIKAAIAFAAASLIMGSLGAFSCLAARRWRQNARNARVYVAVNSMIVMIYFPLGTAAGLIGLYWCCSRKMREVDSPGDVESQHQSMPGDGTHSWVQRAAAVLGIAIAIGSFFTASWWGDSHGLPSVSRISFYTVLLFGDWIATLCHELGHAVAGWACDMRLTLFRVGPFVAQKTGGKWTFGFAIPLILSAEGGVASAPLHLNQLRRRMVIEVAAGPAASLLTAAISYAALLSTPDGAWESWWMLPAFVAAMSAGAALANLIPFAALAGFSDGAILIQLLRGGVYGDFREAMKIVGSTMVTSTRPRDLDARHLAHGLRGGLRAQEELILRMVQVICAVDRGEFAAAREHLEAALDNAVSPQNTSDPGVAAEMAFYIAYLDGNAVRAADWLCGVEKFGAERKFPLAGNFDYWIAVTALRVAASATRDEVDEAYNRAFELVERKALTGLYQYERELLQNVRAREWVRPMEPARFEVGS